MPFLAPFHPLPFHPRNRACPMQPANCPYPAFQVNLSYTWLRFIQESNVRSRLIICPSRILSPKEKVEDMFAPIFRRTLAVLTALIAFVAPAPGAFASAPPIRRPKQPAGQTTAGNRAALPLQFPAVPLTPRPWLLAPRSSPALIAKHHWAFIPILHNIAPIHNRIHRTHPLPEFPHEIPKTASPPRAHPPLRAVHRCLAQSPPPDSSRPAPPSPHRRPLHGPAPHPP